MKSTGQLFRLLGYFGFVLSVFTLLYSFLVIRPLLSNITAQLHNDLTDIKTVADSFNNNQASTQLMDLLPNVFTTLHGTLIDASTTMYSTAKTTNDVKKGVTGLLMPKTALTQDTNRLSKTGQQLTLLADVIGKMEGPVTQMSASLKQLSKQSGGLSSRAEDLRTSIDHAALPTQAALLGVAFSLIFFFLGSVSFAISRGIAEFGLSSNSGSEQASVGRDKQHFAESA